MVIVNTKIHALFLSRYFTLCVIGIAFSLCFLLISSRLSPSKAMKAAINEQRFEDAAVIRDKIKEIQEGKNE